MAKIEEFVDDLKKYLLSSIPALDSNFSSLVVNDAYESENKPNPPEIKVMVFDFSEDNQTNSYNEGENITNISCNIYAYANAMKLNGNEDKSNAVITTTALSSDIMNVLSKNKFALNNPNIIRSTRMTYTGAQAIKDTSCYMAVAVYEFKIINNYIKVYNR